MGRRDREQAKDRGNADVVHDERGRGREVGREAGGHPLAGLCGHLADGQFGHRPTLSVARPAVRSGCERGSGALV